MKNKIYSHLPAIIFGVLVISFLAAFYIFAWTEPSVAPPGGNVPAPLNTGSEGQAKIGGLILNTGGFPTGLIVDQGNVGIGTTSPGAKLEVNGSIRAKNGILMAGTITINDSNPNGGAMAGISAPIDVSPFNFTSANDYQVITTSQKRIGNYPNQQPCFTGLGCYGPIYWAYVVDKTNTSFRILVHDNMAAQTFDVSIPVDYIVVKY